MSKLERVAFICVAGVFCVVVGIMRAGQTHALLAPVPMFGIFAGFALFGLAAIVHHKKP